MDISSPDLFDYKVFCFDGTPRFLYVASDRGNKAKGYTKFDLFDTDFNHLPVRYGYPNGNTVFYKPRCFETMLEIASKLSKGIPHVRVDLYNIDGHVFFGEMTFFSMSGFTPFTPEVWDERFGELLTLPKEKIIK